MTGPPPLPADVRDVLAQLLKEADECLSAAEYGVVYDILDTVETVIRNKVPDTEERERLLGGCSTVRSTLEVDNETASGYLLSMRRRVQAATSGT